MFKNQRLCILNLLNIVYLYLTCYYMLDSQVLTVWLVVRLQQATRLAHEKSGVLSNSWETA